MLFDTLQRNSTIFVQKESKTQSFFFKSLLFVFFKMFLKSKCNDFSIFCYKITTFAPILIQGVQYKNNK